MCTVLEIRDPQNGHNSSRRWFLQRNGRKEIGVETELRKGLKLIVEVAVGFEGFD